jgi:hypothetical protein
MRALVIASLLACACGAAQSADPAADPAPAESPRRLTRAQFRRLMETVAEGWRTGNAARSAACFAEDAIYSQPPRVQFYRGRAALEEFFGPRPQGMTWHHLVFDEEAQIGAGEYTYRGSNQYHGVVMVRIVDGLIANWREYQVRSPLTWEQFMDENRF